MVPNLFLKPEEGKFLILSVLAQLELYQDTLKNERINWNPSARKQLKEMVAAGESLKNKLVKLGFDMTPLAPLNPGDEDEFLTKQS